MRRGIVFVLVILTHVSIAQVTVSSGSIMSITPDVIFFTSNDFINNGTVFNDGNLFLSGAWTNNGTYVAEQGQVVFNSEGPQIINHNAQSFARLQISGGGEKIFRADIVVTGQLSLIDGVLTSENNSKIILDPGATINGGSEDSFVQGAIFQSGTGEKFYPVGINLSYLPVTLGNVSGTNPVVGIEALEPNVNTKVDNTLRSVSTKRYWLLTTLSGTYDGSLIALPLKEEDALSFAVAHAEGPNDPFKSLGGKIEGTNVVSREAARAGWIAVADEGSREIKVYNALTPGNNDNKHDFLKIVNIEFFPDNEVTIINRWGDKVFQISGYNNADKVFVGDGNTGGARDLADGTYYYVIDKKNGDSKISGFFVIRR